MKRTSSLLLAILLVGCVSTRVETPPSDLLKELQGKTERKERSRREWAQVYTSVLAELLPGMKNKDVGTRRNPMQTWQRICWDAGRPDAENERQAASKAMCGALQNELPEHTSVWLISQLGYIGREECIDTLQMLLQSPNRKVAEYARRALTNIPSQEAGKALLSRLTEVSEPAMIVACLNALRPHIQDAFLPTVSRYLDNAEPAVFRAAVGTVAATGSPNAYRALTDATPSADAESGDILANARLLCAEKMEKNGHVRSAREAYDCLYQDSTLETIKVGALRGLLRTSPERLPQIIDAVWNNGSPRLLAAVVDYLQIGVDDSVLATMAGELSTYSGTVQAMVLPVLAKRNIVAGRAAALLALAHDDNAVIAAATRALASLGNEATVPALMDLTQTDDPKVAGEAIKTLQQLPGNHVDTELEKQTQRPEPKYVTTAISILTQRRASSSLPRLLELAAHPSPEVRNEAYKAIGGLGSAEVVPALLKRVLASDEKDAEAGSKAIVAVSRDVEDENKRTQAIRQALDTADKKHRTILIKALGKLAGAPAFDTVKGYLEQSDEALRDAAVRALADWPEDIAVNTLTSLASAAPSPVHRVLALRGAVRLLGSSSPRTDSERLAILTQLLASATRDEDRRTVISGLGTVHRKTTVDVLDKCLLNEALREESGVALVQVALGIAHANRKGAETALRGILKLDTSDTLKEAANSALEALEEFDGFITSWLITEPYTRKEGNTARIDMVYDPETHPAETVDWKPYVGAPDPRESWELDLLKAIGGSNRTAYMLNWIRVDKDTSALLEMGSDDAIKVWLNGKEILRNDTARPCKRGQEKVAVKLTTGWNPLMLKISQNAGGWGGCARVRNSKGTALAGWTFVRNPAQPTQLLEDLQTPQLAQSAREALGVLAKAVNEENPKQAAAIRKAVGQK